MSFVRRVGGTLFDPGRTFKAIAEHPCWADVLVVLLILVSLYTYLIFPVGQKDSLRLMEDNAAKFKEKWGESQYTGAIERITGQNRSLAAFLTVPLTYLFGVLLSALVVLGMGRLVSTQGNYPQVFAVLLHANLVDKLLGNGLRLFLSTSRKSVVQTSTGLPVFFPKLDIFSVSYALLSQVDLFQIWMFVLFGMGLAASFKITLKKGLVISFAFWFLKSALTVALIMLRNRMIQ